MAEAHDSDIDPTVALRLLPEKIEKYNEQITELALDAAVLESMGEDAVLPELEEVRKKLRIFKAAKALYQDRLDAIRRAAEGK